MQEQERFLIQGVFPTGDIMLEEIAITKIADLMFEKYRKHKEEQEEKITTVKFDDDRFTYTELDSTTTINKEIDKDKPDLSFENPYKKPCKVKSISISPDESFKTNGMVEIYIGDELFFRNKKFGNFENVAQSVIVLNGGESLKTNESVKIHLKSETDDAVGLTAQVTFGE